MLTPYLFTVGMSFGLTLDHIFIFFFQNIGRCYRITLYHYDGKHAVLPKLTHYFPH